MAVGEMIQALLNRTAIIMYSKESGYQNDLLKELYLSEC